LEKVVVCTGLDVLVEVDENSVLIVGGLQGIASQLLGPHPFHMLNIIIIY
jgi:hypothetical protein